MKPCLQIEVECKFPSAPSAQQDVGVSWFTVLPVTVEKKKESFMRGVIRRVKSLSGPANSALVGGISVRVAIDPGFSSASASASRIFSI